MLFHLQALTSTNLGAHFFMLKVKYPGMVELLGTLDI